MLDLLAMLLGCPCHRFSVFSCVWQHEPTVNGTMNLREISAFKSENIDGRCVDTHLHHTTDLKLENGQSCPLKSGVDSKGVVWHLSVILGKAFSVTFGSCHSS